MSRATVDRPETLPAGSATVLAAPQPWWAGMSPWPLLLPPAWVALTLLADQMGWRWLLAKPNHELLAPVLLGVTVLLLGAVWRRRRAELFLALLVLSVAFLCREIHFRGTNALVYSTLALVLLWTWRRWPQMQSTLAGWPARGWLVACLASYALSQVIARRVFRFVPGEQELHVPLEELVESGAHLLFLWTAWLAFRERPRPEPSGAARSG